MTEMAVEHVTCTYILELVVLCDVFECSKAVSHGHRRHASMDGYGDNVASHVREPLQTSVHVLPKEASHRL